MAKQKKFVEPPDDIPAWFMTYSDVITLLMTFFILLLTFSTTEPERFEKAQMSVHASGGATGIAGKPVDGLAKDSWITRIRPPAARIATRGSEMPPLTYAPVKKTFGKGLKALGPDEKNHNDATSHYFDVEISTLFNSKGKLTGQGKQICKMLAGQLEELPFQASIQFSDAMDSPKVVGMLSYLFDDTKTRPGQVGMSLIKAAGLENRIRIMITRFTESAS